MVFQRNRIQMWRVRDPFTSTGTNCEGLIRAGIDARRNGFMALSCQPRTLLIALSREGTSFDFMSLPVEQCAQGNSAVMQPVNVHVATPDPTNPLAEKGLPRPEHLLCDWHLISLVSFNFHSNTLSWASLFAFHKLGN